MDDSISKRSRKSAESGHVWEPTLNFRWAMVIVEHPSNFTGGPGFTTKEKELQQAWMNLDGDLEWRPVPEEAE